ncbi:MAG TPA: ABC transporter permease, partial [Stellaceae bacterium]|nr:ABC transporter permease [Stellaceae bacterium]
MHAPLARPVRRFGAVNWQGLWTLYLREVRRFLKVSMQTLFAPVVTTLIFLMIFLLAMNGQSRTVDGVPFLQFLAPGLVMMSVTQNAFANTTSSIMIMKMQGNIIDLLMPPINAFELTLGFALGGLTRGLMVG